MRNELLHVTPTDDFELILVYANGEPRRFDVKPLLSLKPWTRIAAPNVFTLARVAYGTVVWPGHVDIAPETLWLDSHPVQRAERMGCTSEVTGGRTEHTPRVSRIAPSPCLAKARAVRCLHARPDAPREALRRAGAAVFPLGLRPHARRLPAEERDYWLCTLLRQAKPDDALSLVTLDEIREAWPRIGGRLGKAGAFWSWRVRYGTAA